MLALGDKVEVMDSPYKKHIGKNGTVISIYKRLAPNDQPAGEHEKLPKAKRKREMHYRVELNDGTEIQHLREHQLRKL